MLAPRSKIYEILTRAFCFIALLPIFALAERLPFKSYTTSDGLAHDRVNEIVRDSRGFLWFCTGEGLSRFDGYEFKNYTQANGLPHRNITDLLELKDGTYLVATFDGLVVFNPKGVEQSKNSAGANQPAMFRTLRPDDAVRNKKPFSAMKLFQGRNGQIWLASLNGFYRLDRNCQEWQFEKIEPDAWRNTPTEFVAIIEDQFSALWLGTSAGLFRFQPANGKAVQLLNNKVAVIGLLEDREGRIWATPGESDLGICLFTFPNGNNEPLLTRQFTAADGLTSNVWIYSILQTNDGRIFTGSVKGLSEFQPDAANGEAAFRTVFATDVNSLSEDSGGNLWVGTGSNGAFKLTQQGFVLFDDKDGVPQENIKSFVIGADGELFVV
jgi:ligand-binding sensor domain-containing protein